MLTHFEFIYDLSKKGHAFVVITMLAGRGHTPQDVGAKAVVTISGLVFGTIGGGKIEAKAVAIAQDLLRQNPIRIQPQVFTWNLQRDIGMSCGGEGTYLFETFHPTNWQIAVFGAGHVAQALTRTLVNFDCHVTCIDSRMDWINKLPTSHNLQSIHTENLQETVKTFNSNTFFVVMTQGHASDVPILHQIFQQFPDAPFVGVIGSHPKSLKIKTELKEKGIPEELLNRLRCPMGMPIGSNHPYEIALSISAELIQIRDRLFNLSKIELNLG